MMVEDVRTASKSPDNVDVYCQSLLPVVRPATELTRLWRLLIWQNNSDYVLMAVAAALDGVGGTSSLCQRRSSNPSQLSSRTRRTGKYIGGRLFSRLVAAEPTAARLGTPRWQPHHQTRMSIG
jgi:hypothetical protein